MDRNTVLGVALIFTILIGFSYFNRPSEEQIAAAKQKRDSIEQVRIEILEAAKVMLAERHVEEHRDARREVDEVDGIVREIVSVALHARREPFAAAA